MFYHISDQLSVGSVSLVIFFIQPHQLHGYRCRLGREVDLIRFGSLPSEYHREKGTWTEKLLTIEFKLCKKTKGKTTRGE